MAGLLIAVVAGCGSTAEERRPALLARTQALLMHAQQAADAYAFRRALTLTDSAAAVQPDAPEVFFLRGRIYSELGQFDSSRAAYERVLDLDADFPGVWHNLGNNAYRKQAYSEAVRLHRRELEEGPAPLPWRGIGRAYTELGEVDSARFAFEQAVAIDSLYAPGYFSLALLLEDEGRMEEALRHARTAVRLSPEDLDFRYVMAELMVKTNRHEEAIPHLLTVAEAWPWHHASLYNLGRSFIRTGREEQGKALLERSEALRAIDAKVGHYLNAVRNSPTNALSHAALGSVLRQAGRYEDAERAFLTAIHLAPEKLELKNNIANLYLVQKDTASAIAWYEQIVQEDPTFVDVWINLGIVYAISGEERRAREAWQNALEHRPDDPRAAAYLEKLDAP